MNTCAIHKNIFSEMLIFIFYILQTYCRSHGAHLATVQSGSEKDFINGMIQNMPGKLVILNI